jgi:hypothetical protein
VHRTEAFPRIRRLKCDELKPVCQRCIADRQKCDGYLEAKSTKASPRKANLRFINFYHAPRPSAPTSHPAPSFHSPASAKYADILHHGWNIASKAFSIYSSAERLFSGYVLPLSHTSEPIQLSLCALAGAHRNFETGIRGSHLSPSSAPHALSLAAINHYNAAIESIGRAATTRSADGIRTTLICCIIFICVENLFGRSMDAIRHLHSACHLLHSLKTVGSARYDDLLGVITSILHRLGQNVAIYLGDEVVFGPDELTVPIRLDDHLSPFSNIREADQQLEEIGRIYNDFLFAPDPDEWPHHGHFHRRWDSIPQTAQNPSSLTTEKRRRVLEASRTAYEIWDSRFHLLMRKDTESPNEKHKWSLVRLHQALWSTIVGNETLQGVVETTVWETLLQRTREAAQYDLHRNEPVFTFDGDIISTLFTIWNSCQDGSIQSHALQLMRSCHRREGIWDSVEVANLCEAWSAAGERAPIARSTPRLGIPEMMAWASRSAKPRIYGGRSPGMGRQRICDTG